MAWKKSSQELIDAFDAALPADARVERRLMFGNPCAFANGNMFAGLHQDDLFIRLGDDRSAALVQQTGAALFEPTPGRVMREYVVLTPAIKGDPKRLKLRLAEAFAYAASLPAKKKKSKTRTVRVQ